MPVRDDFIIPDLIDIRRDKINLLALTFQFAEGSGEMSAEMKVRYDSIACNDHLLNLATQIRDGGTEGTGGQKCAFRSLFAALRRRLIDKIIGQRLTGQGFITCIPEKAALATGSSISAASRVG